MRAIFLFMALLITDGVVAADVSDTIPANPYMRCAAINYLLNSTPQDHENERRHNYKLEMELHAKWAWVPYGGNYSKYKADYASTMKALQTELRTKSLSGEAFAEEAKNCISLQLHTMDSFLACLRKLGASEKNNQVCAQKVVGP